ncbi:hypothetical protein BZA05DRAFT_389089 [Tricharina praecox]|uniref:uncharacterized protein n=1 Tax=Tricharina praecox TaxID=43433 RepID=UPI002220CD04|nr:uncharacterized protein BZA05DRAFT_389089 [Tricharina praecox]KAI5856608.1 hypothetical protein BZA05DRAFT_389089 [Tricharina praecox]
MRTLKSCRPQFVVGTGLDRDGKIQNPGTDSRVASADILRRAGIRRQKVRRLMAFIGSSKLSCVSSDFAVRFDRHFRSCSIKLLSLPSPFQSSGMCLHAVPSIVNVLPYVPNPLGLPLRMQPAPGVSKKASDSSPCWKKIDTEFHPHRLYGKPNWLSISSSTSSGPRSLYRARFPRGELSGAAVVRRSQNHVHTRQTSTPSPTHSDCSMYSVGNSLSISSSTHLETS